MIKLTPIRSEKGFSLLEVLISIALIGVICSSFLAAMNNAQKGAIKTDQIDTSRALAQGQMEYVKKQFFATSYTPDDSMVTASGSPVVYNFNDYPGYSAAITVDSAAERDACIQKITVTIKEHGVITATLQDCKVK